ncbi:TPA: hypothetical protein ACQ0F8_001617 [Streptococcus agalactiae]|nr:hypothetical protein [Streptococcus agalactiae]HEO4177426.1 hypothetical protein [Streptococcus agalactiae]
MGISDSLKRDKKKKSTRDKILKATPQEKNTNEEVPRANLNMVLNTADFKEKYDKSWENKDFLDIIKVMDIKSIMYGISNQPLVLGNGFGGFMQMLEIQGQDVENVSEEERLNILGAYIQWLSSTTFSYKIYGTNLPTNTQLQIEDLVNCLNIVRRQLTNPDLADRERGQLEQRKDILIQNIITEEMVSANQYNAEFFLWIITDTLDELENNVNLAQTATTDFVPQHITVEKKEQILTQFYNYNVPI